MSLTTRLTQKLAIKYPIVSAPMAFAAGGKLASAVSLAGGLGLVGGGYGDSDWIKLQLSAVTGKQFGIGFITWALQKSVLEQALQHEPQAVMLSFGDPAPFAPLIHNHKASLICQCQNLLHVQQAIDAGAQIIVAQGTEAGGHGATRGTFSFVPEVADKLSQQAPDTLLLAAGGIADGRGLAAALMLGADGVLIGTRLWAASEALVSANHHNAIISATGDQTVRTHVADIARQLNWPKEFSARIHHNNFVEQWHGKESLLKDNIAIEGPKYRNAFQQGDANNTGVWFGEAAGLINRIEPASQIIDNMVKQATELLSGKP